jgi:hypothetical protein
MKYKTFIKRERDTTEKDRKTEHTRQTGADVFFLARAWVTQRNFVLNFDRIELHIDTKQGSKMLQHDLEQCSFYV